MSRRPRSVVRLVLAVLVALGISAAMSAPALARTELVGSFPSEGEAVPLAPAQVVLKFDGRVDPAQSTVSAVGPDGVDYVIGEPSLARDGALVTPVEPRGPTGEWTVTYHVVAADGEPVDGTLQFTVGGFGHGSVDESSDSNAPWFIGGGAGLVLLGVAAVLFLNVRRRPTGQEPVDEPDRSLR